MLFNSYLFIFLFLPMVLAGYFKAGSLGQLAPVLWLALASIAFYAFDHWHSVPLLLVSALFNYLIGSLLISSRLPSAIRCTLLLFGVTGDLLALGYFKYAGFFLTNINSIFSTGLMYTTDSRLQDAGLIRGEDFNAVLIWDSLSVHYRQSDIDRAFGVRSVKLSMSGASSVEENFVLENGPATSSPAGHLAARRCDVLRCS
jgi:hypothetical protein